MWPITFRGERPERPAVGDCYYAPPNECHVYEDKHYASGFRLSRDYVTRDAAVRRPLLVVLPNHYEFCVDAGLGMDNHGWDVRLYAPLVVGEKPRLVVSPSINNFGADPAKPKTGDGGYHGWIGSNTVGEGEISEDYDGRVFPHG